MSEYIFNLYRPHTLLTPRDIYLLQYGEQLCPPSYSFGPAIRNHFILHYVYSGSGKLMINQKTYKISKGQLFIIYPEQSAYYKSDDEDPWFYRWIEFDGDFAEKFMKAAGFSKNTAVASDNKEGTIGKSIKAMTLVRETSFERIMSLLWNVISEMTKGALTEDSQTHTEIYIKDAESFIKNNLHRKITIQEVSDYLKISRNHLSRIYKNEKGISIQQYMISLKLNTAAQYLKNKNLSIKEIALSVGYSDPLEFSKAFKRKFNQSPSEWRKKMFWEQSVKVWPK